MASWVWAATPLVRGACEVLGDEVGLDVGDEVGLDVGDEVGVEVGDGGGDGLLDAGGLGAGQGVADGAALPCPAEAPDEGVLELPRDDVPEARTLDPVPFAVPGPFPGPEFAVPVPVAFSRPTTVRIDPRAKTPATTSTTAPATARAGRNQAMAGPTDLRGRLPWIKVAMLSRDRSAPPSASWPMAVSGLRSVTSERDRILLNRDSHRTTTSQRSTMSSLRSSHHCRLSHGSLSRPRIFVKPSPTGSS
jgi:hypothetical protein